MGKPTASSLAGRPPKLVWHEPARVAVPDGTRGDQPGRSSRRPSAVVLLLTQIDRKLVRLLRQHERRSGDLLKIKEAAAMAGVSPTTIYRAIHLPDGPDKLIAHDESIGRKRANWRIFPADLDTWLKRREGRSTAPSPRTVRVLTGKVGQPRF